jgi:hypothetical protein
VYYDIKPVYSFKVWDIRIQINKINHLCW